MSTIKDGGPAFPFPSSLYPDGSTHEAGELGMSLRDYFAAKAMQGYNSDPDWRCDMTPGDTAYAAYLMADAMLRAREAK